MRIFRREGEIKDAGGIWDNCYRGLESKKQNIWGEIQMDWEMCGWTYYRNSGFITYFSVQ